MTVEVTDPTVTREDQCKDMEKYHDILIQDAPPDLLQFVVDQSRIAGNQAFRERHYKEAVKLYSQAIAGAQKNAALYANRSAAYLMLAAKQEAFSDAVKATTLQPAWPKGFFRLGMAYLALHEYSLAGQSFSQGLQLDPSNKEMARKKGEAEAHALYEQACLQAHFAAQKRDLVLKLRAVRRRELQEGMERQFKQSMTAPDWEMEDYEWRPTFFPGGKLMRLDKQRFMVDPRRRMLAGYVSALADLAAPKAALPLLADERRLAAYEAAIAAALCEQPGAHVLVLGAGSGVLALMAARAGARRVTAVERSRMLFRMARQVLAANADAPGAARVHLIDRPLRCISVQGEDLPPDVQRSLDEAAKHQASSEGGEGSTGTSSSSSRRAAAIAAEISEAAAMLPERADVLVTDLLDHSVLGMGLLSAVDYASSRLLKRGARVVPTHIKVSAMLVEMRITQVSGFDLSGLNRYRWNPGHEKIDLCRVPHKKLSGTFTAIDIDLQQRVDSLSGFPEADLPEILWESDNTLKVLATCTGRWNAVIFWFTVKTHGHNSITTWSDSDTDQACTSWQQCVQYLDETPVTKGAKVSVRVRQDTGQLLFAAEPGAKRPRHAWVPRWHFDMVLDEQRNAAYEKAIVRAIEIKRALGCKEVDVLDIGAGSGLLSLIAARAGADRVTGAEIGQHMCDVAAEAVVMNGYAAKCLMINKDVRRIDVAAKADGTPADMEQKANLCVFEVFDSGLVGEGVLHLLAWAQARLLTPDCTLVPMAATVYCQPIQMRTERVLGFDMAQANQWRWRPDYEGLDLGDTRSQWTALGPVTEVFAFDFYEAEANMQSAEVSLRLTAHSPGTCNAIAFWFSLHLDEETELHTGPYEDKGNTWQQAVQWVEEMPVVPGQRFTVVAKHDTYGLSFSLQPDSCHDNLSKPAVPLWDPLWKATFEEVGRINENLSKATVQNPLEYRATALAAVQIGSRPHDLGLNAEQAAAFCTRYMS